MKHLVVHNVGPLKGVDINPKRINVVIGPQGSGKSCLLKIACFCTWVEKRIELEQTGNRFENGKFVEELVRFHKLDGFIRKDSRIEYESDLLSFQYEGSGDKFSFQWRGDRWGYKRTKICYVPAERNMMAVIPNWFEVEFPNNNIRTFLKDWENARKTIGDMPILNLGVDYHYNPAKGTDEVRVGDEVTVDFINASSGFQSVIPICLLLQYFFETQFSKEVHKSVETELEDSDILHRIYNDIFESRVKKMGGPSAVHGEVKFLRIGGKSLSFYDDKDARDCNRRYTDFTTVDHCDIFLEEPELNLFPSTQHELLNWLIEKADGQRKHSLFIATHSPYIMTSLNNLIEAGNILGEYGNKRRAVKDIIPKERILSYKEVGAYVIDDDGVVRSIMDEENKLISADRLDRISDVISDEFDKLLEL